MADGNLLMKVFLDCPYLDERRKICVMMKISNLGIKCTEVGSTRQLSLAAGESFSSIE